MYANAQGGWGLWERWLLQDRDLGWGGGVRLIKEPAHLVIKSDSERTSALIKSWSRCWVPQHLRVGLCDDFISETIRIRIRKALLPSTILHIRGICCGDVGSEVNHISQNLSKLMMVSLSLSVLSSSCLCCLKICSRSSTLNWKKLPTRSSPSREPLSLMWWSTCGRIRSPTGWSMPYPRWVRLHAGKGNN